ncbi:cysteine-rich motor neuron 1 protein-like isoform X2 [Eupeodes corollae]|nr:cysteine-rich motor neuron 1 protein-like isoform X2 [Eupeodes corollae]
MLAADGKIEELYPSSLFPTTTDSPSSSSLHLLQKRSLQHRRREAIKIVPGDYRSFEPEFFKYHNHHQPHRKWKRDLVINGQSNSEDEIKKCCPEFQCVCRTCQNPPKCHKDHVAIVVEQGHGLPGSCCPKYECVPEMECSIASQPKSPYWRDECLECDCFAGHELCQQVCEVNEDQSALNCFSGYLNRPKMNGDTWLEDDDCKECKCVNGDNQCQESYCKPVDCENPIKIAGKCCKVCPTTSSTTSTTSSPPETEIPDDVEDYESTTMPVQEVPVTTTTTEIPVETSTTTSAPIITSTTTIDVDKHFTTTSTPPSTTTDIETQPQDIRNLLEEIDIIVVLIVASAILVIFTIGIGFVVTQKQKKKKLVYSTIPSSESSQSSSITLA